MVAAAVTLREQAIDFSPLQRDVAGSADQVRRAADLVDAAAQRLAGPSIQRLIGNRARSTSLDRLAPRRSR